MPTDSDQLTQMSANAAAQARQLGTDIAKLDTAINALNLGNTQLSQLDLPAILLDNDSPSTWHCPHQQTVSDTIQAIMASIASQADTIRHTSQQDALTRQNEQTQMNSASQHALQYSHDAGVAKQAETAAAAAAAAASSAAPPGVH